MFFLPQAVAAWIVSIWAIEWRRLRDLLPYGLLGHAMCSTEDYLGGRIGWWEYRDTGPFPSHVDVSTIISLSAAPLLAMYFVQGLGPGERVPWARIAGVTAFSLIPEAVGLLTGHVRHGNGWNFGISVLVYFLNWLVFLALHRWLDRAQ